ncbi:O-antigen ligase [Celeribacter sp. PS-C1]|uniref:O-antigen ligase family protein n=1 Tax=Celeribacter sp. PS-C1 TaxID=2820813 RepID=UPI001CA58B84|nr:O-antigen ligase family protein [Celeribacter sp. PS-C1]MBW6417905.1 O-antigen ligase family protein [Celeribacter sp. PS-C1]
MTDRLPPVSLARIRPAFFDVSIWLPILFATVTFPLLQLSRNRAGEIDGSVSFAYAASIYLALVCLSVIIVRHTRILKSFFKPSDLLLLLFFGVAVLQVFAIEKTSILLNIIVFIGAGFAIRALGYSERVRKSFVYSSLMLCAFIVAAYVLKGPPVDRWLGGIHPNVFAAACVAMVALSFFGPRWWSDLALAIALVSALGVSSRYAIVTCILLYVLLWSFNFRQIGPLRLFALMALPCILVFDLLFNQANSILGDALKLYDSSRGISSGLSGRDGHWSYFLPQFTERPLIGYGFRNRGAYYGAHNGFLDVFLQMGLLGGVSFFLFVLLRFKELWREAQSSAPGAMKGRLFSILTALVIGAQLQPQFINFGDPFGIMVMICLFSRRRLEADMEASSAPLLARKRPRLKLANLYF